MGTAALLGWGLVDATDGDDKHAILDTLSNWFDRGNDGEAESHIMIESHAVINGDKDSDATFSPTDIPTFSPTAMPSMPVRAKRARVHEKTARR